MSRERDAAWSGEALIGRRGFLIAAAGGVLTAAGCGTSGGHDMAGMDQPARTAGTTTAGTAGVALPPSTTVAPDGPVTVTARLRAAPVTVEIGRRRVETWSYTPTLAGPGLRARAGDRMQVLLENALPAETTIHWHGIRLQNAMDGLPGMTQPAIAPGESFLYDFVVPDAGTYFFHPHVGVQGDRGLHLPLVVEDPSDRGDYDDEVTVMLDDWLDGVDGRTPEAELERLTATQGMPGMDGMDGMHGMDGMDEPRPGTPLGSDGGDITYPMHLINGRPPEEPATIEGRAGSRLRLRIINAAADSAYRVAIDGHPLRVTHADGWPVEPVEVDAIVIGMGERYDVTVEVRAGAWQLFAACEAKEGFTRAILRATASTAATPPLDARPAGLSGQLLDEAALVPTDAARLDVGSPERRIAVNLTGGMAGYNWGIDGGAYPDTAPIELGTDESARLNLTNHTQMWHPMHVHGHTFAVAPTGVRRDTVKVRPMSSVIVDLVADNPGHWMLHCHNAYHLAAGMAADLTVS